MAITIGKRVLDGKRTYIVAEGGTFYSRDFMPRRATSACKIVEAGAFARCDAVKFQMFVPDEPLFCPLPGDELRKKFWRECYMSAWQWSLVKKTADEYGVDLFFSVFQRGAIDICNDLGVPAWKVASRAAKTFPYDGVTGPFIVSSGFGLPDKLPEDAITLKCVSKYPAPLAESWWDDRFDGLSDHSGKPWPGCDAIVRGAKMLEVHFRAGKGMHGTRRRDFPVALYARDLTILTRCRDDVAAMRASQGR